MFQHKYNATFDLFSFVPSVVDPNVSVKRDTELAEQDAVWHNKARLVDRDCKIIDFQELGFSERDRIDMVALIARTEQSLDFKRISDCFDDHFFETNFWFEWCSLFALERWHSAIEFQVSPAFHAPLLDDRHSGGCIQNPVQPIRFDGSSSAQLATSEGR